MITVNIFRILGDLSHIASICILIWAIHTNNSAEGVSLITQVLYLVVFSTRYLDLFWIDPTESSLAAWNFVFKIVFITSSAYIIALMLKFARTREREKAWKFGAACLGAGLLLAPFTMLIFDPEYRWRLADYLWNVSIVLESVCVLPQLLLLRQTTVPTVIDSFYLLTLGSYRGFYILNWIVRYASEDKRHRPETQAVIFGVIQTAFYIDFAWVYYTRQRVKLRNGGVVDSEDLSRGWLVGKILGRGPAEDRDEEDAFAVDRTGNVDHVPTPRQVGSKGGWGARGISVSADEGVLEHETERQQKSRTRPTETDSVTRREEITGMLEEDEDDFGDDDVLPPNKNLTGSSDSVGNGEEWRHGGK